MILITLNKNMNSKEIIRCSWCEKDDLYRNYHDLEWGKPVYDDETLFEFLILETFQAGLSWYTILSKRNTFREAFDHFEFRKIALYEEEKVEELLLNRGIIRNRLKILSTITNAQNFIKIQNEFGSFSKYIWDFVDGNPIDNCPSSIKEIPATSALSDEISKELKKRGFKFVGSTVIYAYLQAIGIINDHIASCSFRT